MLTPLIIAALAVGAPATQSADTLIRVDRGTRLQVENHRGDVVVEAWDRDVVQVRGDLSSRQQLDVTRNGSVLRVRPQTINGGPRDAELRISVPVWMDVRVQGNQMDATVRGTRAEISVETVGGDVVVDGGAGLISIRTIQGEVSLRNARGRIEAMSVNEEVTLTRVDGEIYVETTNGDVTMREIRSASTRATTVNGDVVYEGTIQDDGRYGFATHNGDILLAIPEKANATVSVSTFHGEFESDFPVRLTRTGRDRQFDFTLGSGRARIELESFNGEIQLRRPH